MKIEIIGRGPSRQLPDPDRQHWFISSALMVKINDLDQVQSNDMVFNLHDPSLFEGWLKDMPMVRTMRAYPDMSNSKTICPTYLTSLYGPVFASTVSWMMAVAITCQAESIHLNGIDLSSELEGPKQRESLAYMVGMARAQGIKVTTNSAKFPLTWGRYPE